MTNIKLKKTFLESMTKYYIALRNMPHIFSLVQPNFHLPQVFFYATHSLI